MVHYTCANFKQWPTSEFLNNKWILALALEDFDCKTYDRGRIFEIFKYGFLWKSG